MNIKATHIDLTETITEYVEKKVASLGKVIDVEDPTVLVSVEVGKTTEGQKSGDVFRAEIHITGGGRDFYADSVKDDIYAAIDEVRDEVLRQARRSKNKWRTLVERGARSLKKKMKGLKPWK